MFIVCGEALFDVFATGSTPTGIGFDGRIGGSPFNVALGLARLGQPVGFCGGINLIDDRDDLDLGRLSAPRLDFSLQVSGPLVADMQETMEQLWWRLQAVRAARQREFRAAWEALRVGLETLRDWGVEAAPRTRPLDAREALNTDSLAMAAYEAGRPAAAEACRVGDDRFMPPAAATGA